MHIPLKVDYGVRALVYLAQHRDQAPLRAADIAQKTAIPEAFLAQVLHVLGKDGFVKGVRGPQGGHILAREPSEIRLSAVMECLGVTETMVRCLGDSSTCVHIPSCAQREVWERVDQAVFDVLHSTTIGGLVERARVISESQQSDPVAV
jgi:Rrf2 family protein